MEKAELRGLLSQYNGLYKEMDDIYHLLARHYGLSDSALWILYLIREQEEPLTQSQVCEQLSLRKQTVNSALKTLQRAGYILLEPRAGDQRNKGILLTATGEAFAKETVDHILVMEQNVFWRFSAEERRDYLRLHQKYVRCLQAEADQLLAVAPPPSARPGESIGDAE